MERIFVQSHLVEQLLAAPESSKRGLYRAHPFFLYVYVGKLSRRYTTVVRLDTNVIAFIISWLFSQSMSDESDDSPPSTPGSDETEDSTPTPAPSGDTTSSPSDEASNKLPDDFVDAIQNSRDGAAEDEVSDSGDRSKDPDTPTPMSPADSAADDVETSSDGKSAAAKERVLKQKITEEREARQEAEERVAELEETVEAFQEKTTALKSNVETVTEEKEEVEQKLLKLRNKFKNYKERAKKREKQAEEKAVMELVEDFADVRDTLQLAISHGDTDEEDILDGVRSTLNTFDETLEEYGISLIDPAIGEAVDAEQHAVMMREDSSEVPHDTIAKVVSVGYRRGDRTLREAKVIVSNNPEPSEGDDAEEEMSGVDEGDASEEEDDEPTPMAAPEDEAADDTKSSEEPTPMAPPDDDSDEGGDSQD